MGLGRDRRTRRGCLAHLPDGPLGRRHSRRKLCVASGILQGEERRPERRDHGVRHLRPDRGPAHRSRARLFGNDASRYAEESSLPGLLKTNIPLMAASSELDLPGFVKQLDQFKDATCKRPSGCARTVMLPQHSHMSEVYSINTEDTRLTDQILDFVKTGK